MRCEEQRPLRSVESRAGRPSKEPRAEKWVSRQDAKPQRFGKVAVERRRDYDEPTAGDHVLLVMVSRRKWIEVTFGVHPVDERFFHRRIEGRERRKP